MTVQEQYITGYIPSVILNEDFSTWLPAGWTQSGAWTSSSYNPTGGSGNCADLYWYSASGSDWITSAPISTSGTALTLDFKTYLNVYAFNSINCYVEVTPDAGSSGWTDVTPWPNPLPYDIGPYATYLGIDISAGIGPNTQVRFRFSGYYFDLDDWYIDDVVISGQVPIYAYKAPEYEDQFCVDEIDVCEELQVCFDDWTPATPWPPCGSRTYKICMETRMCDPLDENTANNIVCELITVDFWHDVAFKEFTKPSSAARLVIWDNGGVDVASAALSSQLDNVYPFNSQVADDFILTDDYFIDSFTFWGNFWGGTAFDPVDYNIYIYADDGTGTQPTGAGMANPETTALAAWDVLAVPGIPDGGQLKYTATLSPAFPASAGTKYWIVAQSEFVFPPQWGWCNNGGNPDNLATSLQGFPLLAMAFWTDHGYGDMAFYLEGHLPEVPIPDVYIACGTQDICANFENLGTFVENGCTVDWELFEFMSNPPNPTSVDSGSVVIDLGIGEVEEVCFVTYDFTEPGIYQMDVMITAAGTDCYTDNNDGSLVIGVDCCPPESEHELDPATPNGQNNWYTTDVEVTLTAVDELCPDPCEVGVETGISEIKYTVNGVAGSIPGASGSFILDEDGNNLVEYWAIDGVGNIETKHTFTVAIDQTKPTCSLTHTEYETGTGWAFDFEAIAADVTSGMNRVEFKRGTELLDTITTPPYEYTHTWESGDGAKTFYAYAYDQAGNSASDSASIQLSKNLVLSQGKVLNVNKVLQKLI
jgi:hypothetical protein